MFLVCKCVHRVYNVHVSMMWPCVHSVYMCSGCVHVSMVCTNRKSKQKSHPGLYLVPAFCPRSSLQTVATEGRSGILSFSLLNMYLYLKLCLYLYLRFHTSRLATQPCWPNRTAAPIENARRSLEESSPVPPGPGLGVPPNKVGLAIALLNVEGTRYT